MLLLPRNLSIYACRSETSWRCPRCLFCSPNSVVSNYVVFQTRFSPQNTKQITCIRVKLIIRSNGDRLSPLFTWGFMNPAPYCPSLDNVRIVLNRRTCGPRRIRLLLHLSRSVYKGYLASVLRNLTSFNIAIKANKYNFSPPSLQTSQAKTST